MQISLFLSRETVLEAWLPLVKEGGYDQVDWEFYKSAL